MILALLPPRIDQDVGVHRNRFAQAFADMMIAKDEGLDDAVPRSPESTTPTSFRQWCEDVLAPAIADNVVQA